MQVIIKHVSKSGDNQPSDQKALKQKKNIRSISEWLAPSIDDLQPQFVHNTESGFDSFLMFSLYTRY